MRRIPAAPRPATNPSAMAQKKNTRMVTSGDLRSSPAAGIVAALLCLAVALLAAACNGSDDGGAAATEGAGPGPTVTRPEPEGPPRAFKMGFSSLPPEQTTNAYVDTVATVAQYGDLLLI